MDRHRNIGGVYYYITSDMQVNRWRDIDEIKSRAHYVYGNYFLKKSHAEAVRDELQKILYKNILKY